jgi:hypothetical protein
MVTSDEYKQLFAFKRMNLFNRMYMILNIESYDAYDKWSWYYRAIVRNNNSKLFLLLGIR